VGEPISFRKYLAAGLMVATLAFTLVWLQQQFDKGDHRKAVDLLMSRPPGMTWSVADELNQRAGDRPPECSPKLVSSFAGTLVVTCEAHGVYKFAVDLVRKTVTPADPAALSLMQTVASRNLTDGGTPLPSPGGRP
jgi:hypothetical protein